MYLYLNLHLGVNYQDCAFAFEMKNLSQVMHSYDIVSKLSTAEITDQFPNCSNEEAFFSIKNEVQKRNILDDVN